MSFVAKNNILFLSNSEIPCNKYKTY
jgi:hypothetical protein